jgi:site-specific recombinase XerD
MKEEIHFHTLRHSFASNLGIKGVPIIVIKELLGHSSITTTEIYSHTNIEALQKAVKQLKVA